MKKVCARIASAVAIATLSLIAGCGSGRLTPTQTCSTSIDAVMRCGGYTVGAFGGRTEEEDVMRCSQQLSLLNDRCQDLASQVAQCAAVAECGATTCQPQLDAFNRDCSGP